MARIKDLEEAAAQAEAQAAELRKQHSNLESEKEQIREERDAKVRALSDLAKAIGEKEGLLNERAIAQKSLEEKLEEEKKAHGKAQAHSRRLEAALLDLERAMKRFES